MSFVCMDFIYKLNDVFGEINQGDRLVRSFVCTSTAKVDLGSMVGWQKVQMVDPRVHGSVHALVLLTQCPPHQHAQWHCWLCLCTTSVLLGQTLPIYTKQKHRQVKERHIHHFSYDMKSTANFS